MDPEGMARLWKKAGDFAHTTAKFILLDILNDIPIDTGAMLRSTRLERTRRVYRPSTRIWVGTDHWVFTEYGVRPHTIHVRTKKTLASATRVFGPVVNHPGVKPVAYMRKNLYKKRIITRWL